MKIVEEIINDAIVTGLSASVALLYIGKCVREISLAEYLDYKNNSEPPERKSQEYNVSGLVQKLFGMY